MRLNSLLLKGVLWCCFMAAGVPLRAAEPSWWARQGVKNTNAANDHAVATVGQAMHVAACARQEFDAAFSVIGGAGKTINELIANYYAVSNFNAIRIGQLKYIASLYWNRLGELGIYPLLPSGKPAYPWTPATNDDNDNALATLGQLKMVFSFVTDADSDSDGLPDWWEKEFFPAVPLASVQPTGNDDNDQLTNAMEWARGGDPRVPDESTGDGKPKNILVGARRRGVSSYKRWTADQKAEPPPLQARRALKEAALMGDENVVSEGQPGAAPGAGSPLVVKIPTKPGLIYNLEKLNQFFFVSPTGPPHYFTSPVSYAGNGHNLIFTVKDGPAGSDPGKILNVERTGNHAIFTVKKNFAGQTGLNLLSMFDVGGEQYYGVIQALSWNPALAALTGPGAYGILPPGTGPAGRTVWGPASTAKWLHLNPLSHNTHAPSLFHWPADGFKPFWVHEIEESLAQGELFTKWFTYPEILDSSDPDIQEKTGVITVAPSVANTWRSLPAGSMNLVYRVSEPDTDRDGIPDCIEFEAGTDPYFLDLNNDGLSDFLEEGLDPNMSVHIDTDVDGRRDWREHAYEGTLSTAGFGGTPYSGDMPKPSKKDAVMLELLGDTPADASTFPGWSVPPSTVIWKLTTKGPGGDPVTTTNPASKAIQEGGHRYIRLDPWIPYTNGPTSGLHTRLELDLPLSSLNSLDPESFELKPFSNLPAVKYPRNRYLYLQYRWRGVSPMADLTRRSVDFYNIPIRQGALVFRNDRQTQTNEPELWQPYKNYRFLSWERQMAMVLSRPLFSLQPVPPLTSPLEMYWPGQFAVAPLPVACPVTTSPMDLPENEIGLNRVVGDYKGYGLDIAQPRGAISSPLLGGPAWSPVDTWKWHTVTIQFDLLKEGVNDRTAYMWLDRRGTMLPDALVDLELVKVGNDHILQKKPAGDGAGTAPWLRLRWNGSEVGPMDLCGFYVGLTNPLFPDEDHDRIPPNATRDPDGRNWQEWTRTVDGQDPEYDENSVNTPTLDMRKRPDADYDGDGHPILFRLNIPSKESWVQAYDNRTQPDGFEGPWLRQGEVHHRDEMGVATAPMLVSELIDSDADFLPDAWELDYFSSIAECRPEEDSDGDGVPNAWEFYRKTNPRKNTFDAGADTDNDGLTDGQEKALGFNYWDGQDQSGEDPDGDGLTNMQELNPASGALTADVDIQRALVADTLPLTKPAPGIPVPAGSIPPSLEGDALDQWLPAGHGRVAEEDADGDTVRDSEDAVPYDPNLTFAPVPESSYLIIPLTETVSGGQTKPLQGTPVAINNLGHVLLSPLSMGNANHGTLSRKPARLWRGGPGQVVEDVPLPEIITNPTGIYQAEWAHTSAAETIHALDLAKDSSQVLGHAYWRPVPANAALIGKPEDNATARVPYRQGMHAFAWKPAEGAAPAVTQWLSMELPLIGGVGASHFLPAGRSDCSASLAGQLLSGGRVTGKLFYYGQSLKLNGSTQIDRESFSFLSWTRSTNAWDLDASSGSRWFGKGTYQPYNAAAPTSSYIKNLYPDLMPDSVVRQLSMEGASVELAFTDFSWGQRALLRRSRNFTGDLKFDTTQERVDYETIPSYGTEYSAGGSGPGSPPYEYYYCPNPWTNPGAGGRFLLNSPGRLPNALNDMPDQRGQQEVIQAGGGGIPRYVRPFSTGPLIVGEGGYWVARPDGGLSGTSKFQAGLLIASPAPAPTPEVVGDPQPVLFVPATTFHGRQALNDRGEILGYIQGGDLATGATALWRNGRGHPLDSLMAGDTETSNYTALRAQAINDSGTIAATATDRRTGARVPAVLQPVEINSLDKYLDIKIPETTINMMGGAQNFSLRLSNEVGESYTIALSNAKVYERTQGVETYEGLFFPTSEAASEQLDPKSYDQETAPIAVSKENGVYRFVTCFDRIGAIQIEFQRGGLTAVSMNYTLTEHTDMADLIDRLDLIFQESFLYRENGGDPAALLALISQTPVPAAAATASGGLQAGFFSRLMNRNLVAKCCSAVFDTVKTVVHKGVVAVTDGVNAAVEGVKIAVVGAQGFCVGFWAGVKMDAALVTEFIRLLAHPIDTGKSLYEGFRTLCSMNSEQLKAIPKKMLEEYLTEAQKNIAWASPGSIDLIAYTAGYAAGFLAEQVLVSVVLGAFKAAVILPATIAVGAKVAKVMSTVKLGQKILGTVETAGEFLAKMQKAKNIAIKSCTQFINDKAGFDKIGDVINKTLQLGCQ